MSKDCPDLCDANVNAGGPCNVVSYRSSWGGYYFQTFPSEVTPQQCGAENNPAHPVLTYVRADLVRANPWQPCGRRTGATTPGAEYSLSCGSFGAAVDAIKIEHNGVSTNNIMSLHYVQAFGTDTETSAGDLVTLTLGDWESCHMYDSGGTTPSPYNLYGVLLSGSNCCDPAKEGDMDICHNANYGARSHFIGTLKERAYLNTSVTIHARKVSSAIQFGSARLYYWLAVDQTPIVRTDWNRLGPKNCWPGSGAADYEWDHGDNSWKKYHAPSDDRRYAELTLQGCKDLCSSTPGCDTFAWNQDGPMCYMRKLILPHRFDLCSASPGWEGFYRDVGWTVTASTYCHAGVSTNGLLGLGRFRETALGTKFGQNDCRALCQDTATCNGFAYSNYYCDLYNFPATLYLSDCEVGSHAEWTI